MYTYAKWLLCFIIFLLPQGGLCFGAGQVGAELNGHAFLHGDLGQTLLKMAGIAFTKREVDAIYFGNWLRDYSQAMDIKGLGLLGQGNESMAKDAIMLVIQVLSFMSFGFATREFKVTFKKLGVYSHAEHIDNPKGYESNAQEYHPGLRGEVFKDEYEVDLETGMKNYIAHEGQGYNTSTNYIRQTLKECIAKGRISQRRDCDDNHDALHLLGSALHTLEDFLAHTNWCELVIKKLSKPEADVFCFAGAKTYISTKDGLLVPPLVTGTFGGEDFLVSIFGSVDDHLCPHNSADIQQKILNSKGQQPMQGLNKLLNRLAKSNPTLKNHMDKLAAAKELGEKHRSLLQDQLKEPKALPDTTDPSLKADNAETELRRLAARKAFQDKKAAELPLKEEPPSSASEFLWDILNVRDEIMQTIIEALEAIGLSRLLDEFNEMVNKAVWAIIANIIEPAVDSLAGAATKGHEDLLYTEEQTRVFKDPSCSDPTHSWLAKDHFKNSLHLPAAKVAAVVVEDCVKKVTTAWTNQTDADTIIDEILEVFHHPYFPKEGSIVQNAMSKTMETYMNNLGDNGKASLLSVLTLEAVHSGLNVREIPKNPASTGSAVGEALGNMFKFGVQITDTALEEILTTIDAAEELINDIKHGAETAVNKVKEVARDFGEKLDEFGGEAEKAVTKIGNDIEDMAKDVGEGAINVYNGAGDIVNNIGRGAEELVNDIGQGAGEVVNDIGRGAEEFVNDVGRGADEVVNGIGRGAEEFVNGIGQGADEVVNDIGRGAEGVVNDIGSGATAVFDTIGSWF